MWQYRMWGSSEYLLPDGKKLRLIDPGRLNVDAGPDFFNAKIFIDDIEWVGNIEIHVRASDWYRHNHDKDFAYDNVILHVVGIDDAEVRRTDGSVIPQIVMPLQPELTRRFSNLQDGNASIRCGEFVKDMSELSLSDWLETLACERLQSKSGRIIDTLAQFSGDWEQTCFVLLARTLGFGLNSEPFELLAKSLPLTVLHHHSDSLLQIQALLYGQAGMLDMSTHILDEYYQRLCREYYFLQRKYSLRPLPAYIWKYARTRPSNFPHRRIALLSEYVAGGFSMMQKIIAAAGNVDLLRKIFDVSLSGYWETHSSFDVEAKSTAVALSRQSIELILINTVAPLYYAYGNYRGDMSVEEMALDLLSELKPENNSIITQWGVVGVKANNALRSQALIQLRREYCDTRKCLYCRIGNKMLRQSVCRI